MKSRTSRHILSLLIFGVAGACALFIALILQLVGSQNAIAHGERQHRALAVLNNVAAVVRYDVTNTANWDEAYRRFLDAPDKAWFQENIGAERYGKMNHVLAAVVDGAGRLMTGAHNGAPVADFSSDDLMKGLSSSLLAATRSPGLAVGTFLDLDGVPVYASVARICSHSVRGACSGRFLVLATTVETLVQDVALSTGWRDLKLVREAPLGPSLPVAGPDGQGIAYLTWKAPTPGFVALKASAPWVGGALAVMVLSVFGLFQRVRRTTNRLEEATDTAQRLAVTDAQTGIMNRRGVHDAVERHLLARKPFHLVALDLDGFKEINDTLGHESGDIVLHETARRLERMVPADGLVARLGGDEFVVLVPGTSDSAALEFGQDLSMSVHQPFAITGQMISVSASVGVARGLSEMRADEVLRRADVAMYAAKSLRTGGTCLYEPHLDESPMLMRRLDREMRDGLRLGQFHVEYQPILSVASGAFGGVEALLRWRHPERGLVSPATFIPAAETSRLIVELGEFVLREACVRLADRSDLSLSVNLSPVQLLDDQLAERVRRILAETGFDPARLELEVTEGYLVSQEDRALKTLTRLREDMGLRVSLDDFGCGYASIGFLRRFPLDKIKIDKSFVQPIEDSPEARRLLLSMIGLCKAFEIPITAEGVETEAQSAFLRAAGCDNLQGYLLAKPSRTLPEVDADWRWDVA